MIVTIAEASRKYNLSVNRLRYLVSQGYIVGHKSGKVWLIEEESLRKYMSQHDGVISLSSISKDMGISIARAHYYAKTYLGPGEMLTMNKHIYLTPKGLEALKSIVAQRKRK